MLFLSAARLSHSNRAEEKYATHKRVVLDYFVNKGLELCFTIKCPLHPFNDTIRNG